MLCVWLPRRSDHSKETAKEREGFRKASTSLSASLEDESDGISDQTGHKDQRKIRASSLHYVRTEGWRPACL